MLAPNHALSSLATPFEISSLPLFTSLFVSQPGLQPLIQGILRDIYINLQCKKALLHKEYELAAIICEREKFC
ncbi:hypothetical protein, partial [Moorena sp. SIO3I8]|uniref:hypothetical protein n=1 Tax=Moorena sp. SIO3I8 TaxID=2607833 RepID=UPI0025ECD03E